MTRHDACLLQVWWFISGIKKGKLFVHDLATCYTMEVPGYRSEAAIMCMHADGDGLIWMGYKGGYVRVWSAATRTPICPPTRATLSDVR